MPRYYWLTEDKAAASNHQGDIDAAHRWKLPGLSQCPGCSATWASTGHYYPAVDLSGLPEQESFLKARPAPFSEYVRLRDLVRPFAPPDVPLPPGTRFGPLEGTARGNLGTLAWLGNSLLLLRRETLEQLRAENINGLLGGRTSLRFRQKSPPELFELQLEPHGRLHPDCLPEITSPPCETCGRIDFSQPDAPVLDTSSLPSGRDLFRVGNFATMIIGNERFREAVLHLGLEGIRFRELPLR